MKSLVLLLAIVLVGCASRPPHSRIAEPPKLLCTAELRAAGTPCLSDPYWNGTGDLVQSWVPSQLSPFGCWMHRIIFFSVPEECKGTKKIVVLVLHQDLLRGQKVETVSMQWTLQPWRKLNLRRSQPVQINSWQWRVHEFVWLRKHPSPNSHCGMWRAGEEGVPYFEPIPPCVAREENVI